MIKQSENINCNEFCESNTNLYKQVQNIFNVRYYAEINRKNKINIYSEQDML